MIQVEDMSYLMGGHTLQIETRAAMRGTGNVGYPGPTGIEEDVELRVELASSAFVYRSSSAAITDAELDDVLSIRCVGCRGEPHVSESDG